MADPFLVPADLADYDEADAALAIAGASAIIRSYCGWHIGPPLEETLEVDGNGATVLPLPSLHVVDVDTVEITEAGVATDVTDEIDWTVRGLLRWARCFPTAWRSVAVTLTHGYSLDALADVKAVAKSAATRLLSNPEQVRSTAILGYSETFAISATGEAMALALNGPERFILDRYRLPQTP